MANKYLLTLAIVFLGFVSSEKAYASVLYYSSLNGTDSFSNTWTNILGAGSFSSSGLTGTAGYNYNIGQQEVVIKATVTFTANSIASLRCRENFERSTIEQSTYQDGGLNDITEGINGNYYSIANATNIGSLVGTHTYELDCLGNTIINKLDGIITTSGIQSPSYPSDTTYVSFYLGNGSTLKNLVICSTIDCNYPSSDLSVPLLKQTDPQWGDQTYDSANVWNPSNPKISRWGCAMTSTAMILQYYGITKLPDNTDLNPGTLNTWLNNQPDGYIGEGNLNWVAISRLSKQAKSVNQSFAYDALEYVRGTNDTNVLTDDINNGRPDILEEPGHYIVATGVNGNTFDINDPAYNRTVLTDTYNNIFLSTRRYIPSHTDLSYIMLTVDPTINISVETATHSAIGDQFVEQPYGDPADPTATGGTPLKIVYIPKPSSGIYTVTLSGSTNQGYTLGSYLYDINGNVNKQIFTGTITQNSPEIFTINFDNLNDSNSSTQKSSKIVTFTTFIQDVNNLTSQKQIVKLLRIPLLALIDAAQDSAEHKRKAVEKIQLETIQTFLGLFHNKGISDSAYQILSADDSYLITHL